MLFLATDGHIYATHNSEIAFFCIFLLSMFNWHIGAPVLSGYDLHCFFYHLIWLGIRNYASTIRKNRFSENDPNSTTSVWNFCALKGWCDKILTLSPGFENHKKAATPRAWARDIETLAMECFEDMARRTAGDDTTDAHFESIANHELEKAGWDYRVDFLTPKELWGRRWDEQLNSHTFAAHVADKMNLAWPGTTPIVPTYSYWLLDSMLAAPGSKSLTAAESSARPHTPFATSHRATTPVPIATI